MDRDRARSLTPQGRFVGRASSLDAIAARFDGGAQLVTLVGPPGIGKTRLATRFAEIRAQPFAEAGGVWFCDLTESRTAFDACAVVARTMGRSTNASPSNSNATDDVLAEVVADELARAGPILLILDNFEQLDASAARIVAQWCGIAPEARVLATSRARLAIPGESVLELSALELPDPREVEGETLRASEAVILFEERARAVGGWNDALPDFVRDAARLVRELEGIPLAIELAAARSRVLTPAEMIARLARSSEARLGARSSDTSAHRHSTLRAAIDASWSMLSAPERAALAQCSAFAGDFSLVAAEHVIDVRNEQNAPPVLELIASLRDKSLVRSATLVGETRFSLYISIREYAAERAALLPDVERANLAERHRRFYLDAAAPWSDAFLHAGDARSRAVLASEKNNLLAVYRSLLGIAARSSDESADLARSVLHLAPTLETELPHEELIALYSHGIQGAQASSDDVLCARLLIARANSVGLRGDSKASLADLEEAEKLATLAGNRAVQAEAMCMSGVRHRLLARFEEAWSIGQRALALAERSDCPRALGACAVVLGLLLCELGRTDEARRYNVRARGIFHGAGDAFSEALAIANIAQLDQVSGRFDEAAHGYDRAIDRFRAAFDRRYEARYLAVRATLEHERGDLETARMTYAAAVDTLRHFHMH